MYSSGIKDNMDHKEGTHIIDVRSDTVTTPTAEMRHVMANAEVGDDVYGEDPTVNELQAKAAKLLGKEAGLFVPSGSMGNLISIMVHCPHRGDEILVGDQSHITLWEQGSAAQLAGIHARQVRTNPDGTLDLEDLKEKINDGSDAHWTHSKVICLEQTHNSKGGCVLPLSYLDKVNSKPVCGKYKLVDRVQELAKANNLAIHMDGARLFNAVAALNVPAEQVVRHMDSVMFCLSKGLGAPIGSIVVGSKEFIDKCHRHRKALGGGMRQAGIVAKAGIYALDHIAPKIIEDHNNAKRLAEGLHNLKGIELESKVIESNMVYFKIISDKLTAHDIVQRMGTCTDGEEPVIVKFFAISQTGMRIVFHHQVLSSDVDKILHKLEYVLQSH
ncbi:hypothetical protein QZH41_018454 [Actinostola sp. cb2023]|nr:hypothetical protein QZH41_018454 [Actinostola sp. cb2023]